MEDVMSSVGRLSTHCFVRRRFWVVWEAEERPSIARCPSHQQEDMGATLVVPSGLVVEMRMMGVPK
jgi:hypothetical protein